MSPNIELGQYDNKKKDAFVNGNKLFQALIVPVTGEQDDLEERKKRDGQAVIGVSRAVEVFKHTPARVILDYLLANMPYPGMHL